MTVHTIKQCRPDQKETEYFWKLFHAAQRNDARWHGSESSIIADELSRTDLDRNQKLFLLRAWQVLVDDKGGFGRFMGAFDTYVYNMQDPDDDCVAWKPELSKLLCDGQLLDVVIDAYQSARQRIAELEARTVTLPQYRNSPDMNTNHPAHGPVSLARLKQIREILSKASAQSDGGNLGYAMADAVKVIDEVLASRNAEPVADVVAWYKEGEERTCDIRWRRFDVAPGPLYAVPPKPASNNL